MFLSWVAKYLNAHDASSMQCMLTGMNPILKHLTLMKNDVEIITALISWGEKEN